MNTATADYGKLMLRRNRPSRSNIEAPMNVAPVLFVSHGAPTFALDPGVLGPRLRTLGAQLTGVKAILVVSAHWQTRGVRVMTSAAPATMHDFGGFDPALYELQYPVAGHPKLAQEAGQLLADAGFEVAFDAQRGLDHGAWVPLRHLLPDANVPVFQVSMPSGLDPAGALRLGRALAPLRARGVLIVGSGSLTHNLYELEDPGADAAGYAREFAGWVRKAVIADEVDALVNYRREAPHAARAHPTDEHYLPLLVAAGALAHDEIAEVLDGGVTYGVLSMESYAWGVGSPGARAAVH